MKANRPAVIGANRRRQPAPVGPRIGSNPRRGESAEALPIHSHDARAEADEGPSNATGKLRAVSFARKHKIDPFGMSVVNNPLPDGPEFGTVLRSLRHLLAVSDHPRPRSKVADPLKPDLSGDRIVGQ